MKLFCLLSVLTLALIAGCKSNNTKPVEDGAAVNADKAATVEKKKATYSGPRRYLVKSGIIQTQHSGIESGTSTLYFDDYGMKEAKFTDVTNRMRRYDQKQHELRIIDGDIQYSIDLTKKSGTRKMKPFYSHGFVHVDDDSLLALSEKIIRLIGGKKIGKETVAGKKCDVWEIKTMNTKFWMWKAFKLKTEITSNGGKSVSIVTFIQENVPIPAEKFAVPKGIVIEEASPADAATAK